MKGDREIDGGVIHLGEAEGLGRTRLEQEELRVQPRSKPNLVSLPEQDFSLSSSFLDVLFSSSFSDTPITCPLPLLQSPPLVPLLLAVEKRENKSGKQEGSLGVSFLSSPSLSLCPSLASFSLSVPLYNRGGKPCLVVF